MKIKMLREHYYTTDSGVTWTPKVPFETEQEARDEGLNSRLWHIYVCSHCGKLHAAKVKKDDNDK